VVRVRFSRPHATTPHPRSLCLHQFKNNQQQQSGAAQFSDVFQTLAPDGDPWSLAMSVPRMDTYNARLSSVPQMQSPAPLFQFRRLALPMQEAAERQQFCSWMLHQLHNTPVEKSRTTMGQNMYNMMCSKTQHADKASKIAGMILEQYHGFRADK